MTILETYIRQFARLRRAPNAVFSKATRRLAPHKPILLLAVLDLVGRGVIISPFIGLTGDLVELKGDWGRGLERGLGSGFHN